MIINWHHIEKEVTNFLQHLIRCNTTNPPGNEILCANYIADVLKHEGIEPHDYRIRTRTRKCHNALKRWKTRPALMLLGQTDVVAVEPDKWSRDPFGGELHNDYIWGRGALDMKNIGRSRTHGLLALETAGCGTKPRRDLCGNRR